MRQRHESQVAAAGVKRAAFGRFALATFDHAHHCLRLATPPVDGRIEILFHDSAVTSCGRVPPRPTVLRRNVTDHTMLVTREFVIGLRVVSGIGDDVANAGPSQCWPEQPAELVDVGLGPGAGQNGEDQVACRVTG